MVELTDLVFGYRKQPLLFDGLNLRLNAGQIYGLLGKNGAGKTTLLKNMLGLIYPKSGLSKINGLDAAKRFPDLLQQVFFLPEEIYIPDSSAKAFIDRTGPFYPKFNNGQLDELLENFEVPLRKTLSTLSLGQQKKFMIAFGLACNTPLLVMDEPTNGLDIPSKAQFRKVLAGTVDEQRCVVISTHQVRDLDNLIDTVLVLHERQIRLHIGIDELSEKLRFGPITHDEKERAFYYEETFNGLHAISENLNAIQSKPDLELLFNAMTAQQQQISEHLNQN